MAETITAHFTESISQPELSRIWESQRTTVGGPEIVFESAGDSVTIRLHSADGDPQHTRFKRFFEQAVHRYHPHCRIDWAA